jgi:hypothetical protein
VNIAGAFFDPKRLIVNLDAWSDVWAFKSKTQTHHLLHSINADEVWFLYSLFPCKVMFIETEIF